MGYYAYQRTSDVRYTRRPPANRRAARWAWDRFAKDGPIEVMWLGQGYWMVIRQAGEMGDEIDATVARWHSLPPERRRTRDGSNSNA